MKNKQQISDFTNLIKSSQDVPLLVVFYSPACGSFRLFDSTLAAVLSKIQQKLKIIKVDSEEHYNFANQYHVYSLPVLLVFKNGQLKGRIEDEHIENLLKIEQLSEKIKSLIYTV